MKDEDNVPTVDDLKAQLSELPADAQARLRERWRLEGNRQKFAAKAASERNDHQLAAHLQKSASVIDEVLK